MNNDEYRVWNAIDREDYMHHKGGVKCTSLFTLDYLERHLDELSEDRLEQLIRWADGAPGANFGNQDSETALRSMLPSLPPLPLVGGSPNTP